MALLTRLDLEVIQDLLVRQLVANDRLEAASAGQAQPLPSSATLTDLLVRVNMALQDRRGRARHVQAPPTQETPVVHPDGRK